MELLKRLWGLIKPSAPAGPDANAPVDALVDAQPECRVDMAAIPHGAEDFITGWRYCATMQMRTPAFVLRRHMEYVPLSPAGPPKVSDEMWHGIWVPVHGDWLDSELDIAGMMASEVGYVRRDGGDYLPFLLAVREVSEAGGPVAGMMVALRDITTRTGPHGTPFATFCSAEALIDRVLPPAITQLPVPSNILRAIQAAGYDSLRQLADATDAQLLGLRGLGPKSLQAIRTYLASTTADLDAKRFLAPDFAAPG